MVVARPREEHYRIERRLADRLRKTTPSERQGVARAVYDELYRTVPDHPDLTRSQSHRESAIDSQTYAYERWVRRASDVLEIGAGDCGLLARLSDRYGEVRFTGIDVTRATLDKHGVDRARLRFAQGSAIHLPFSDSSFDFVYSSQVLEHLHPDDVPTHLAEVRRVLRPGGWLGFDTPNRVTGPHDVSRGFTRTATGLHLKEWTYRELIGVLRAAGLEQIQTRALPGRIARALSLRPPGLVLPAFLKVILEWLVALVPHMATRRALSRALGVTDIYLYAQFGGSRSSRR